MRQPSSASRRPRPDTASPRRTSTRGGQAGGGGIARQRADRAAAAQQLLDQEAADVAGGAGDECWIGSRCWSSRQVRLPRAPGFDPGSDPARRGMERRMPWTSCRRNIEHSVKGLAIKEVAERTGIAAATIRMWEQRYGFPEPAPHGLRLPRVHRGGRRGAAARRRLRERGPVGARRGWSARARRAGLDRPAVDLRRDRRPRDDAVAARPAAQVDAARDLARDRGRDAGPRRRGPWWSAPSSPSATSGRSSTATSGWRERRRVRRVRGLPRGAASATAPTEVPITRDDALGNEWAVVVDAPGYAACLLAWETPESQRDGPPARARAAASRRCGRSTRTSCAAPRWWAPRWPARAAPAVGERMERMLRDRPLAFEEPAPGLTALTNRIVGVPRGGGRARGGGCGGRRA